MPIDDIDYLKKNSVKQNYLFVIDSKDRDHIAYPTPSSYTIELTVPFYNVVGFQLVEASIPRTMYNVDITNNSLSFFIHDSNIDINTISTSNYIGADGTRTVDTGDYTIQTLITALNGNVNNDPLRPILLGMNVNNDPTQPFAQITAQSLSNPPELKNVIQFSCPYPFVFDMANTTIAETLGFDLVVQPSSENVKPILEQRYTTLISAPNNYYLYHSVDIPPNIALGNSYTALQGPQGVVRKLPISSSNYIAQAFQVQDQGYLTEINFALTTSTSTNNGINANLISEWSLYSNSNNAPYTLIHTYTYNSNTSQYDIAQTSNAIGVIAIDGTYSITNNKFQVYLNPGTYWVVMTSSYNDNNTNTFSVFYNDIPTNQNYQPLLYLNSNISGLSSNLSKYIWNSVNDTVNGIYFQASIQVIMQNTYHYLTAPGIYSLYGDRYIVVRCPEIEQHAFNSFAYTKECLGIARIKLGVVGYSEYSGDFSSVPLREFHPIGKLPKLTFNFQRSDGTYYDFKGVNHTMTFAVYYYEPIQQKEFKYSILNPNYNGNYIEYMNTTEGQEEESDDQSEDYDRDAPQNYQIVEARHLPETIQQIDQEALYRFSLNNINN